MLIIGLLVGREALEGIKCEPRRGQQIHGHGTVEESQATEEEINQK